MVDQIYSYHVSKENIYFHICTFIPTGFRYTTLFPYKPDPMPNFFRHTLMSRIQKLGIFKGLRSFRGPQKQERKNDQNSIIFGEKNKLRRNFIREKLMEFLLFNEFLKNLIFFHLPIKKIGFIRLIMSKFIILKAYLWFIYRKKI